MDAPGHRLDTRLFKPDGGGRKVDCATVRLRLADIAANWANLILLRGRDTR